MRYIALLFLIVPLLGCGNNQTSDYKPPEATAREALIRGLTAWKEGTAIGAFPSSKSGQPGLQFIDYQWSAAKRLKEFKVLDEPPAVEDSTYKFRVRLEIGGEKPGEAEYYINGIDPLWILRDKDYHQSSMH